jgi:hypothetical protein
VQKVADASMQVSTRMTYYVTTRMDLDLDKLVRLGAHSPAPVPHPCVRSLGVVRNHKRWEFAHLPRKVELTDRIQRMYDVG